jgi:hypothetical protein
LKNVVAEQYTAGNEGSEIGALKTIQQAPLGVVVHNNRLGALRQSNTFSSALRVEMRQQPSLESSPEGLACARRCVFVCKVFTVGPSLVFRVLGPVHDILALPNTCKRKVPEIAVHNVLEALANQRHILAAIKIRFTPAIKIE